MLSVFCACSYVYPSHGVQNVRRMRGPYVVVLISYSKLFVSWIHTSFLTYFSYCVTGKPCIDFKKLHEEMFESKKI
jgi:hypothetical protein